MAIYDLYGFKSNNLDLLAKRIEKALDIKLQARSSDYIGEYYASGNLTDENYELKKSIDDEGEMIEKQFPVYQSFFYLNESRRANEVKVLLEKAFDEINLLRRENI